MDATEAGNTFCARIYGMGDDIYSLLTVQTTIVHITLGYDDGAPVEVMTGLLTEKAMEAGDQWYEATLKGVDFVFDQLQRPTAVVAQAFKGQTVGAVATAICQAVGVDTQIPDPGPTLATRTFNDQTPFAALNILADIACFSLQAKDGKLWMGKPGLTGRDPDHAHHRRRHQSAGGDPRGHRRCQRHGRTGFRDRRHPIASAQRSGDAWDRQLPDPVDHPQADPPGRLHLHWPRPQPDRNRR